jgi:hypothetical protein
MPFGDPSILVWGSAFFPNSPSPFSASHPYQSTNINIAGSQSSQSTNINTPGGQSGQTTNFNTPGIAGLPFRGKSKSARKRKNKAVRKYAERDAVQSIASAEEQEAQAEVE